tara:strand:- start:193 stop:930 length:738 start_codon:yes stop_codon:yes gene_type:complete
MKNIAKYLISFTSIGLLFLLIISVFVLPYITKKNYTIYLPDVRNLNIVKAEKILNEQNFKVEIIKSNFNENYLPNEVVSMIPRAHTKVKKGRTIKLKIAGEKGQVLLEDFHNKSLRNTKIFLNHKNILIDTLIYEYNTSIMKDHIIDQYPKKEKLMQAFDKVTLIVSLGSPPDYYTVPNLININFKKAKDVLNKSGLLLGKTTYEYSDNILNNTILEQSLTPDMKLSFPHKIDLIISTDRMNKNE